MLHQRPKPDVTTEKAFGSTWVRASGKALKHESLSLGVKGWKWMNRKAWVQNSTNFMFGEQWEWSGGLKQVGCGSTYHHRGRRTGLKSKGAKQVTAVLRSSSGGWGPVKCLTGRQHRMAPPMASVVWELKGQLD